MKYLVSNRIQERGLLTSAYKQEIRENINAMKAESLYRVKCRLKKHSDKLYSETATVLKISFFAILLVAIVF